ncbi:MAG: peptidase M28, partial [Paraglaciecola chathamensis]
MRKIQLAAIPLISATLFACGMNSDNTSTPSAGNDFSFAYQSISDATLKAHTKTLASDEFEGRSPTSHGEKVTLDYLVDQFKQMGYQPGNGDSYLQAVNLLEMTASPDMTMT